MGEEITQVPQSLCRSQRTACGNWFSPFTMCGSQGLNSGVRPGGKCLPSESSHWLSSQDLYPLWLPDSHRLLIVCPQWLLCFIFLEWPSHCFRFWGQMSKLMRCDSRRSHPIAVRSGEAVTITKYVCVHMSADSVFYKLLAWVECSRQLNRQSGFVCRDFVLLLLFWNNQD